MTKPLSLYLSELFKTFVLTGKATTEATLTIGITFPLCSASSWIRRQWTLSHGRKLILLMQS